MKTVYFLSMFICITTYVTFIADDIWEQMTYYTAVSAAKTTDSFLLMIVAMNPFIKIFNSL